MQKYSLQDGQNGAKNRTIGRPILGPGVSTVRPDLGPGVAYETATRNRNTPEFDKRHYIRSKYTILCTTSAKLYIYQYVNFYMNCLTFDIRLPLASILRILSNFVLGTQSPEVWLLLCVRSVNILTLFVALCIRLTRF